MSLIVGTLLCLLHLCPQVTPLSMTMDDHLRSQLTSYEVLDPFRIISKRSLGDHSSRHLHFEAFNRSFHLVLHQGYGGTSSAASLTMKTMRDGALHTSSASSLFADFFWGHIEGDPNSRVWGYQADKKFYLTIDDGYDVLTLEPMATLSSNQSDTRLLAYYDASIQGGQHFCDTPNSGDVGNRTLPPPPPSPTPQQRPRRRRRRSVQSQQPPLSRVCRLQLVADHTFVRHVGSGSRASAAKCLIKIVDDINMVYQGTRFVHPDTGEVFTGFGFELASLTVLDEPHTAEASPEAPHFNAPVVPGQRHTASHYLEAFGDGEQNGLNLGSYCLNHLVTFRPMRQNILGLAYLGSQYVNYIGGVCSQPSLSTYGRKQMISRNIGMASYANKDGQPILSRQALLVSAHELGHNLGSEHDPVQTSVCSPAWSEGGPYLMYQIAVTGNADHHDMFSECSGKQIALVIKARQSSCFHAPRNTFCGNLRHEPPHEECDAGPHGDVCCRPDCRLRRPLAECSPANAPCCAANCRPAPAGTVCQRRSPLHPCQSDTHCNGVSDACPKPANLLDGTSCQFGVGHCVAGKCDSVCGRLGAGHRPCNCQGAAESCLVCCQPPSSGTAPAAGPGNRTCSPYRRPGDGATVNLPANQPCTGGRCLANGTCQALELGGGQLIVRLWDLIVQSGSNSVAIFLWKNIVFTVIFLSLLLWVPACAIISYQDREDARKSRDYDTEDIDA